MDRIKRTEAAIARLTKFSDVVDRFIEALDERSVYGYGQIGAGVAILMSPQSGVSATMTGWGFTAETFAVMLIIIGITIVVNPKTKWYPVLLFPFLVYITAWINYLSRRTDASLVSMFIFIAYWLNGVRAVRRGQLD